MQERRKKIFLTGGNGFIGKNIQEQLGATYDILAPRHSELELTDTLAVQEYLDKHSFDVIIHAANIGGNRKQNNLPNIVEVNLRMFFNIVRARKSGVKLVFCGSGAEYDKSRDIKKIRETDFDERVPKDDYGFYKYVCSKMIENLEDALSFRIFGLYGKYEDADLRFISSSIKRVLKGEPIEIWQNVVFDYVYVSDFVHILQHAIEHNMNEKFYNIGAGTPIDLVTIAKKIHKILGRDTGIVIKNEGLNNEYTNNSERLRSELSHMQFMDYDEGISELAETIRLSS